MFLTSTNLWQGKLPVLKVIRENANLKRIYELDIVCKREKDSMQEIFLALCSCTLCLCADRGGDAVPAE